MAEKKQIIRSAYYALSLDIESTEKASKEYVGKLRSDFGICEFSLFGEGENPRSGLEVAKARTQHAAVIYCRKSLVGTKDENIDVLIPKITDDSYCAWRPMSVLCACIVERTAYDPLLQKSLPQQSHLPEGQALRMECRCALAYTHRHQKPSADLQKPVHKAIQKEPPRHLSPQWQA
eukprot:TRINITY_DN12590_c0_g1_i3.p1 TRINITY_DN12590_c0_g1~~TRINITY_DN12590_c0_g1_i3.p1  ORF type:complete len:177 (+),score=0.57 TRINITY_DN12590_c0_g1_i3:331-861(+)